MNNFLQKNKKVLTFIILCCLFASTAFVYVSICKPLFKFMSDPYLLRGFVESKGFLAQVLFCIMVILQTILAAIPGEPLEIAAGYAFGALEGTILCIVAMTIASMLVFFLVRTFGVKIASIFFKTQTLDKLKFWHSNRNRHILFAIIFAIPGTPKDLLCFFAGLTDINPWAWLLICSFGRIPSIITSTLGGHALGVKSYIFAVWVFLGAIIFSIVGLLIYRIICKYNKKD